MHLMSPQPLRTSHSPGVLVPVALSATLSVTTVCSLVPQCCHASRSLSRTSTRASPWPCLCSLPSVAVREVVTAH